MHIEVFLTFYPLFSPDPSLPGDGGLRCPPAFLLCPECIPSEAACDQARESRTIFPGIKTANIRFSSEKRIFCGAATQIWTGNLILANPTKKLFQGVSACFWLFSLSFNYALGLFARSASSVPSVSVACYVVKCQRFRSLEILRSRRKCVEWARAFDSLCPYPFPSLCL